VVPPGLVLLQDRDSWVHHRQGLVHVPGGDAMCAQDIYQDLALCYL
jgi:hypothetical protein